jgi:UDP-glucose 4-epimerase
LKVLVTGGAGYVGSVVTERLVTLGHSVIVVDNLVHGHREAVTPEAQFVIADIRDYAKMESIFRGHGIDAVIHLAAHSLVSSSLTNPASYFQNNVASSLTLLDAMLKCGVQRIVFSSSAAVYGNPAKTPVAETSPTSPINPYGETKLMLEKILDWYGQAYGLKHVSLRYFNAGGASERFGEDHRPETHLIPIVLRSAANGSAVAIFGKDYPTTDGTCIRDYVHVFDLAEAHCLALERIDELTSHIYNLGNGYGFSVLDVMAAANRICGVHIPWDVYPRRAGDPAILVASSDLANKELGWTAGSPGLDSIVDSAWRWLKSNPTGYTT